jgi:ATP-dependent Lon protease
MAPVAVRPGRGLAVPDDGLADLLREPAEAALSYVRDGAARLLPELPSDWFSEHDIRVFQPWGSPPAGPSEQGKDAGLAIAAALVSLLSGRVVRTGVAVTGGFTPAGDLRPAARPKDKAAAAKRGRTQRLVAPASGRQRGRRSGNLGDLELVLVSTADQAMAVILTRHRLNGYAPPF